MKLTRINAGTQYPVDCGAAIAQLYLTDIFKDRLEKAQVAIITDREVSGYYISDFVRQFERFGVSPVVIVIDGSQAAKSFDVVRVVFERLTDIEFSRSDILFALGGGGVMDVAGFVCATYKKGIEYIQIPTSLLAMIDSSMSPDSFLNFQSHKNQIGVTYSPVHVIIDTDYLRTLPSRYQANGVAQVIQFGLLDSNDLLARLGNPEIDMLNLIDMCIQTRKMLLASNPEYFTFGQEIADAIEGHFRFLKYTHGEARALGMLSLFQTDTLRQLYVKYGLPLTVTGVTRDTLLKRILKNYENRTKAVPLVRLKSEGKPFIEMISMDDAPTIFDNLLSMICK
jgi:3-dehydroquinate synthase